MKKIQHKFIVLCVTTLLFGTQLFGCVAKGTVSTETADSVAKQVLQSLYSIDQDDATNSEEALKQSINSNRLPEYLHEEIADLVTEDGIASIIKNRVVGRIISAWPNTEVAIGEISLEKIYSQTETENFFKYNVSSYSVNQNENDRRSFEGEIWLILQDGKWYVESIT